MNTSIDQSPLASFLQQIAEQHSPADADPTWVFTSPLAINDPFWPQVVVIRDEHCQLLRSLTLRSDCTISTEGMHWRMTTTSRPFGNSDVLGDCADALGWSHADLFADADDPYPCPLREQRCLTLLHDLPACLRVVLQRGFMETGVFVREWRTGRYQKSMLTTAMLDAVWGLVWGMTTLEPRMRAKLRAYAADPEGAAVLRMIITDMDYAQLMTTLSDDESTHSSSPSGE